MKARVVNEIKQIELNEYEIFLAVAVGICYTDCKAFVLMFLGVCLSNDILSILRTVDAFVTQLRAGRFERTDGAGLLYL